MLVWGESLNFRQTSPLPPENQRAGEPTRPGSAGGKALGDVPEQRLPGVSIRQQEANATGISKDHATDFEELAPESGTLRPSEFGTGEAEATKGFQQEVAERGEQQPELVGPPDVTTGAVREQAELLFLDPVFHVAPRTIDVFVQRLGVARQVGDQEPWIFALGSMLGFEDHLAGVFPGAGGIGKLTEDPLFFRGGGKLGLRCLAPRRRKLQKAVVLGQAHEITDAVAFAPGQNPPSAEARIGPEDDFHLGPDGTQPLHQSFQDRPGVLGRVDLRGPEIADQQLIAAKDVKRQEAIVVIVAMEEPAFLMPMDRIIGRVEIQDELIRRRRK